MTNRTVSRRESLVFVGCLLLSATWLLACAAAQPPRPPLPPPTYSFNYEPPKEPVRPVNVTLALVRPSYEPLPAGASPQAWRQWPVVTQYLQSMGGDFQRMLIAKGFRLTGPFEELNLMTYPDKQTANLTLTPRVYLNVESRVVSTDENAPTALSGTAVGSLTVNSWITFELLEPLSGEKMWIKKLTLQPNQEQYTYDYRVIRVSEGGRTVTRVERSNNNSQHVVARVLEGHYATVMGTAWNYFNADEVSAIKKMSDEIREKKRF